jgi:hypothetical protein
MPAGKQIEYGPIVRTRHVVTFLIGCRDQVASVSQIGAAVGDCSLNFRETRFALRRLEKVKRVDEIFRDMWHLE